MSRFHNIDGERIQFTPEEETTRDAEEATWEERKPARAMSHLRTERNALLASSDWTQAADSPLTDEVKATWATYRQELRDIPETHASNPDAVVWPTPPE